MRQMLCAARSLPTDAMREGLNKDRLRKLLKERRAAIPPEKKKELDEAIVSRIAASDVFARADVLLLYAPLSGEVNLLPLVRLARKEGKAVAFPRCDTETNTMRFYLLLPEARLLPGAYGIPEPPKDAPLCEPTPNTLCLLPALTFDIAGRRLGYGKGYYDRFLADFPGVAAGAVYSHMMLKEVPTEAHDRPVTRLFTDQADLICRPAKAAESVPEAAPIPQKEGFFEGLLLRLGIKRTRALVPAGEGGEAPPRALHAPPLLVLAVFLLLVLSHWIDTQLTDRSNELLMVTLLQLAVFALPAAVYWRLRGKGFFARLRFRAPKLKQIWFLLSMLVVMMAGSLLCGILTGGISSLSGSFTLYDTFVARVSGDVGGIVWVILAYAFLPAFCEELVFRAILCAEYEAYGVGVSMLVSALFFSMLHASFSLFLTYLLLGLLLAAAMYTTRSFFAAFLLHAAYNLFCLFGRPYLSAFYLNAGSNEIFVFCLVVLFLLFGAFAAGEARKIYHRYARADLDSSYTQPLPIRRFPKQLLFVCLSPAVGVCIAVFLLRAIFS